MLRNAVTKVGIDQTLVRNSSISRHTLEIGNHIFREAHGDRHLELGCVGITTRLHLGEVVSGFMAFHVRSLAQGLIPADIDVVRMLLSAREVDVVFGSNLR